MKIITLGFLLVFIGILVILAGMLSMAYHTWKTGGDGVEKPETGVRGGGVIMIGPVPLIFGSDVTALKAAEERLEAKNESLLMLTEHLESTNLLLKNHREEIEKQKEFIENQKKKSDELLLNILPFEIAEQLKKKGFAKSKKYKFSGSNNINRVAWYDETTYEKLIEKIL